MTPIAPAGEKMAPIPKYLAEKGYKGANWSYEDDLTPHQYQVFDRSVISKHEEPAAPKAPTGYESSEMPETMKPIGGFDPAKGGTMFHGTGDADFAPKKKSFLYLAPAKEQAGLFAGNIHRLGEAPKPGAGIVELKMKPGKVLNVDEQVLEMLMESDTGANDFANIAEEARRRGARYVAHEHPDVNEATNHADFTAVASLFPDEDLQPVGRESLVPEPKAASPAGGGKKWSLKEMAHEDPTEENEFKYQMIDAEGKPSGGIVHGYLENGGKTAYVLYIGSEDDPFFAPGKAALRDVFDEIKAKHPTVENIKWNRTSGAHADNAAVISTPLKARGEGLVPEQPTRVRDGANASEGQLRTWVNKVGDRMSVTDGKEADALGFIHSALSRQLGLKLSQKKNWRFAYSAAGDELLAGGGVEMTGKEKATIRYVGSLKPGEGAKVMQSLEEQAAKRGAKKIDLIANGDNESFYKRLGYSRANEAAEPGYGGFKMEKTLGSPAKLQFDEIHDLGKDHDIPSEPGYVYHATSAYRVSEIAGAGKLEVHTPDYGTDQAAWPDGSTEKRSYFTTKAKDAWQFAPDDGKSAIVRMKRDPAVHKTESTGDVYSKKTIPAAKLEVLGADKQWHPVSDLAADEEPDYSAAEKDVTEHFDSKYKKAGDTVDGRTVRDHVPNFSSIDASLGVRPGAYDVLDGVREVSMDEFDDPGAVTKRTKDLAEQIRNSGELNPLIVGIDHRGPYILEGGHRFDALRILKAKSFPAIVAIDLTEESGAKPK